MTQEFVTLPREVVEQAIDALYCTDSEEGSPAYNFELKAIEELRAALEQPQNHIPGVRNMVPTGWKLVPVVPTVEMMDAGGAATRRCYQHLNKDEVMCSYVYRHMLAAAPDEDGDTINALRAAVQQACDWISEEPGRRPISAGRLLAILTNALAAAPQPPVVEQPQVEREPLTDDQISRLWSDAHNDTTDRMAFQVLARAIEASHNIK